MAIKGALYEPIGMWMPDRLRPKGTSYYVQGVEMPLDDQTDTPAGMEKIELPETDYLFFQSQPYPEEKMDDVIGMVQGAMGSFRPDDYGWEYADDVAPRIQFAPHGDRGYIEARPVRRKKTERTRPLA